MFASYPNTLRYSKSQMILAVAALLSALLLVQPAFADTQTRTIAGSVTSTSADWSNLATASAIGNGGGCAFPDDLSPSPIQMTDWGFTIPAGSIIDGISVQATGASTAGGDIIQMIKGGTAQGDTEEADGMGGGSCPGSTDSTIGGAADLWGLAWSVADINASNFGVQYDAEFQGRQFDGTEITVHFTPVGADIEITSVENSVDPVIAGSGTDNIDYTFSVANIGTLDATGVVIELSPATTIAGIVCTSVPSQGGVVGTTWTVGAMDVGDPAITLVNKCTVPASASSGSSYSQTLTLDSLDQADENGANDSSSQSSTVALEAQVIVTKSAVVNSPNAGGNAVPGQSSIDYTIGIVNNGPSNAPGVDLDDTVPADLINCIWDAPTEVGTMGATEPADGQNVLDQTFGMPAGSSVEFTVSCDLDAGATTSPLVNTATAVLPAGVGEAAGSDLEDSAEVIVESEAQIIVTKSAVVISPNAGGDAVPGQSSINYTIGMVNNGPSNAPGMDLDDTIPSDLVNCVWAPPTEVGVMGATEPADGQNVLDQTFGMPANSSVEFTVACNLISSAGITPLVNTATAVMPAGVAEAAGSDLEDSAEVVVQPEAQIIVTKDVTIVNPLPTDPNVAERGKSSLIYVIGAANAGPSYAIGLIISDAVPDSLVNCRWTGPDVSGDVILADLPSDGQNNLNDFLVLGDTSSIYYTVECDVSVSAMPREIVNVASATLPDNLVDRDGTLQAETRTPVETIAIPTLGAWALMLLVLSLAGLGFRRMRRETIS